MQKNKIIAFICTCSIAVGGFSTSASAMPAYIYSNESVSTWDKHKGDGNNQILPNKTTFDVVSMATAQRMPIKIQNEDTQHTHNTMALSATVPFDISDPSDKTFFQEITEISLKGNYKDITLVKDKDFTLREEDSTGYVDIQLDYLERFKEHHTAESFRNQKGYPIIVKSSQESREVVANFDGDPHQVMVINTNVFGVARQGEDVTFKLYGFNPYVIETRENYRDQLFEGITLINEETGEQKELQMKIADENTFEVGPDGKEIPALKYKDWSLVGNALRLTAAENNFTEPGHYKIIIKFRKEEGENYPDAEGYFTVSAAHGDLEKTSAEDKIDHTIVEEATPEAIGIINEADKIRDLEDKKEIDAVSRATGITIPSTGGDAGSSGGTGGSHAFVVYDTDMVVNAWALHLLGYNTRESDKIYERYKYGTDQGSKFVSDKEAKNLFELNRFKDVLQRGLSRGEYIDFDTYKNIGTLDKNRTAYCFHLLEDGTLGLMTPTYAIAGKTVPAFSVEGHSTGEDMILTIKDTDYLNAINTINIDTKTLEKGDFKIQDNLLILPSSYISRGNHDITIHADGYKLFVAAFESFPAEASPGPSPKVDPSTPARTGHEVTLKGFDSYFTEKENNLRIKLTDPHGQVQEIYAKDTAEASGIGGKTYDIKSGNGNARTITFSADCFPDPGQYIIEMSSKFYQTGKFGLWISGQSIIQQAFTYENTGTDIILKATKPFDFIEKHPVKSVEIETASNQYASTSFNKKGFLDNKGWGVSNIFSNQITLYNIEQKLEPGDKIKVTVDNGGTDAILSYVVPSENEDFLPNRQPDPVPDPKERNNDIVLENLYQGQPEDWSEDSLTFTPSNAPGISFVVDASHSGNVRLNFKENSYDETNPLVKILWQSPNMSKPFVRLQDREINVSKEVSERVENNDEEPSTYYSCNIGYLDFLKINDIATKTGASAEAIGNGSLYYNTKVQLVFKDGTTMGWIIPHNRTDWHL